MQKKLGISHNPDDINPKAKEMQKELRNSIFGYIDVDNIPFDVQEEITRQGLNIPPHIWEEYNQETKGRVIASSIIKSQIEAIERLYAHVERNKKTKKTN